MCKILKIEDKGEFLFIACPPVRVAFISKETHTICMIKNAIKKKNVKLMKSLMK